MAVTFTSTSRCKGSALALVGPHAAQMDSRKGLLCRASAKSRSGQRGGQAPRLLSYAVARQPDGHVRAGIPLNRPHHVRSGLAQDAHRGGSYCAVPGNRIMGQQTFASIPCRAGTRSRAVPVVVLMRQVVGIGGSGIVKHCVQQGLHGGRPRGNTLTNSATRWPAGAPCLRQNSSTLWAAWGLESARSTRMMPMDASIVRLRPFALGFGLVSLGFGLVELGRPFVSLGLVWSSLASVWSSLASAVCS